ncbi:MAG: polysaccharide deacetylase family protein [Nitrospirae bacterium]|nr:polysaccharide deacetylase family protein [Nitrospirota bacterium]
MGTSYRPDRRKPKCLLSIDVEDWFHLIGAGLDYQFRTSPGGHEVWSNFKERIIPNTHWVLDLLDVYRIKATFFILGWVAEQHPDLVREIHRRGHEIASHSYWHKLINIQSPSEFRGDLRRSLDVVQDITGEKVLGFRASTASITDWALDILAEQGLHYDSSLFPVSYHDVYGKIKGTNDALPIEKLPNGLWEVKFSTLPVRKKQLPWSGGGYFRLLPYQVFRKGMRRILAKRGVFMFYIHPWELDSKPPPLPNLKTIYRLRRYVFIKRTRSRFKQLLNEFNFIPVSHVLKGMHPERRASK